LSVVGVEMRTEVVSLDEQNVIIIITLFVVIRYSMHDLLYGVKNYA